MAAIPTMLGLAVAPDPADVAEVTARVVEALDRGEMVIVPTDTVYGLAVHPRRPSAVDRIFAAKHRDRRVALAVLAADSDQALELVDLSALDPQARGAIGELTSASWPGPLTLVAPRSHAWRDVDLGGDDATIGVRVPDAPLIAAVADRIGPIVATSANRSGEPTPTVAARAVASLAEPAVLVVDGGPLDDVASTVIDVTEAPFRIVRAGAFDPVASGLAVGMFASPATTPERGAR